MIDQIAYTSIKTARSTGAQIIAETGVRKSIQDLVAVRSSLRRQIPPEITFTDAMTAYEVPDSQMAITYIFNAGVDEDNRPNRLFAHTILMKKNQYQKLGGNPYYLRQSFIRNADLAESRRIADQGLPPIDLSEIIDKYSKRMGEEGQSIISEMSSELASKIVSEGIRNEQIVDVIEGLLQGNQVLVVTDDNRDTDTLGEIILELIPAPIRFQIGLHTFCMDYNIESKFYNLLITPQANYSRLEMSLPPATPLLDLTRPNSKLNVKYATFSSMLLKMLNQSIFDAISLIKRIEQAFEEAGINDQNVTIEINNYVRALELLEEANEIGERTPIGALIKFLEAADCCDSFIKMKHQALLKGYSRVLVTLDIERYYIVVQKILELASSEASIDYLDTCQTIIQDLFSQEQFHPLLLDREGMEESIIRLILEHDRKLEMNETLTISRIILEQADFVLSDEYLMDTIGVLNDAIPKNVFQELAWEVAENENGLFQDNTIRLYSECLLHQFIDTDDMKSLERLREIASLPEIVTEIGNTQLRILTNKAKTTSEWQRIAGIVADLLGGTYHSNTLEIINQTTSNLIRNIGSRDPDLEVLSEYMTRILDARILDNPRSSAEQSLEKIAYSDNRNAIEKYGFPIFDSFFTNYPDELSDSIFDLVSSTLLGNKQYDIALAFISTRLRTTDSEKQLKALLNHSASLLNNLEKHVKKHESVRTSALERFSNEILDIAQKHPEGLKEIRNVSEIFMEIALYYLETGIPSFLGPALNLLVESNSDNPSYVLAVAEKTLSSLEKPFLFLEYSSYLSPIITTKVNAPDSWLANFELLAVQQYINTPNPKNYEMLLVSLKSLSTNNTESIVSIVSPLNMLTEANVDGFEKALGELKSRYPKLDEVIKERVLKSTLIVSWKYFMEEGEKLFEHVSANIIYSLLLTLSSFMTEANPKYLGKAMQTDSEALIRFFGKDSETLLKWLVYTIGIHNSKAIEIQNWDALLETYLLRMLEIGDSNEIAFTIKLLRENADSWKGNKRIFEFTKSTHFQGEQIHLALRYLSSLTDAINDEQRLTEDFREQYFKQLNKYIVPLTESSRDMNLENLVESTSEIWGFDFTVDWLIKIRDRKETSNLYKHEIGQQLKQVFNRCIKNEPGKALHIYFKIKDSIRIERQGSEEIWRDLRDTIKDIPKESIPDAGRLVIQSFLENPKNSPLDKARILRDILETSEIRKIPLPTDTLCSIMEIYTDVLVETESIDWTSRFVQDLAADRKEVYLSSLSAITQKAEKEKVLAIIQDYVNLMLDINPLHDHTLDAVSKLLRRQNQDGYVIDSLEKLIRDPRLHPQIGKGFWLSEIYSSLSSLKKETLDIAGYAHLIVLLREMISIMREREEEFTEPAKCLDFTIETLRTTGEITVHNWRRKIQREELTKEIPNLCKYFEETCKLLSDGRFDNYHEVVRRTAGAYPKDMRGPLEECIDKTARKLEHPKEGEH